MKAQMKKNSKVIIMLMLLGLISCNKTQDKPAANAPISEWLNGRVWEMVSFEQKDIFSGEWENRIREIKDPWEIKYTEFSISEDKKEFMEKLYSSMNYKELVENSEPRSLYFVESINDKELKLHMKNDKKDIEVFNIISGDTLLNLSGNISEKGVLKITTRSKYIIPKKVVLNENHPKKYQ